jgi:RND family efflux transporter MFP subunit
MNTYKNCSVQIILILVATAMTACSKAPSLGKSPQTVFVTKIQSEKAVSERQFTGTITPRVESNLSFRVGGKVIRRNVEIGQQVMQGELLAELDDKDYQLGVGSASEQLHAANIDANQAVSDAERFRRLSEDGSIGSADLERQQAKSDAAEARAEQARQQLDLAKNRAAYTKLIAPFDGVVTGIQVEPGQVVAEGQPVVTVAKKELLEITVDIPEGMANDLTDFKVTAQFPELDKGPLTLRLRELPPSANAITRTFRARYTIPDQGHQFKIGMTADVKLTRLNQVSSVDVPLSAILSTTKTPNVWTVDPSTGSLKLERVELIQQSGDTARIRGLRDGTLVVTVGAQNLDQNIQVRPVQRPLSALTEDQ